MSNAQPEKLPGGPSSPSPSPSGGRTLDRLGFAWEHLRIDEVGFGKAAWLSVTPSAPGLAVLGRSSNTGAGARALRIGETGQVPEIEVENRGGEPLLVPSHVVLVGGWQTRAVERAVVVRGGGSARVPVKCVEAGRWAPRDERTAGSFEVTDRTGMRTRWSANRSMAEQLHVTGRFAAEQSVIWQHVDEELSRTPMASRTRSYEAYLRGVKQGLVDEAKKAGVRPPPRANAVVMLPRGGGFWIEAYPNAEALAEHADDLLADLFDPAARGEDWGPFANDVDGLLERLWQAPLRELDRVAGTEGDSFAFADLGGRGPAEVHGAVGAALVVGGALAHLAVGAPPASAPRAEARASASASASANSGAGGSAASSGLELSRSASNDSRDAGDASASGARPSNRSGNVTQVESAVAGGDTGALDRPRVDLETMRAVYARARDLMPEEPPARDRVQGYRLVRVLDRNISWVDVRIGGEGYAVLGSHDRCDLVLSNDSGIWLRHMAAICVRLDDDAVGLRLIDLKTDLPFFIDDESPRWSIIASGAFAMRLGRHVVCGFPIGPLTGDEPTSAPSLRVPSGPRRELDAAATGILETGAIPSERNVVSARAPSEITSFLPSAPVSQIQDLMGPSPSPQHVRVTLERGGMGASVELPTEALDAGILLGRALNCFDGGLRRIFCEAISRAHVLLLRDHEDVFAYDLCSTNGTRVSGQRIRRHRLSETGTTLELGKKVVFRWHSRPR